LERQSSGAVLALSLFLVFTVGLIDTVTGYEISFSLLYLAPVALAAWYAGAEAGSIVCALSAITWIVADVLNGHRYSHVWIPVWNSMVRFGFFIITAYLLVALKGRLSYVQELARLDELTGILNRRSFFLEAQRIFDMAARKQSATTLLFIDLDDFKGINDVQGHAEGDRLLKTIAESMKRALRVTDLLARMGGDEFAVLLPETDSNAAKQVVEKLKSGLSQVASENTWMIGFSIGALTFLRKPPTVDEAVHTTDLLMYSAKRKGKNMAVYETYGA
jgi:diguanylate cyclase (GGDEF)-like protein